MPRAACVAGALCLIALCRMAAAHPVPFSYLDLRLGEDRLEGSLVIHVIDIAHELGLGRPEELLHAETARSRSGEIAAFLRARLVLMANDDVLEPEIAVLDAVEERQALRLGLKQAWSSYPGILRIRCDLFPYDQNHQTFLNLYEDGSLSHQEIFGGGHQQLEYFTGSRQGILSVLGRFLPAGIEHIVIGPDHVLFLIGLLLLGGSMVQLLKIITAFTLAHSVTLSLAALDMVNPPARVIEPAIALSIVYIGLDNLMVRKESRDVRAWIAFVFGFVHGFGFASVLREFGLPSRALGWSLFSFNFGVEIGQACIVAAVAWLLAFVRSRHPLAGQRVLVVGSGCVIAAGAYWFLERVFWAG